MEPTPAECLVLDTLGDVLSWTGISVADGIYIAALLDTPDEEFRAAHPPAPLRGSQTTTLRRPLQAAKPRRVCLRDSVWWARHPR